MWRGCLVSRLVQSATILLLLKTWYSRQGVPGVGRTLTAREQGRLTPEDSRVHSSEKTAPRCVSYIKHSPGGGVGVGGFCLPFPGLFPDDVFSNST